MKQTILIFGGLSIVILLIFQLSKWSLIGFESEHDVIIVVSGALFILIGFLINKFIYSRPKDNNNRSINHDHLKQSKLSKQEYKVLQLMAEGLSNTDIADNLFIAESTVKTHVSRILTKLEAKRRTEAIKISRDLHII